MKRRKSRRRGKAVRQTNRPAKNAAPPRGFNPEAAFRAAVGHQQAGRLHEAEQAYKQILTVIPETAAVNCNLAVTLRLLGQFEEAFNHCQKALDADPNLAAAHATLGSLYGDLGEAEKAIAACERALALRPNLAEAHNTLGSILQAEGDEDGAEASYRRALAADPAYAEAHTNLGAVFDRQDRFEDAIACYEKALTVNPDHVTARNNLGAALARLGRLREAVRHYERALDAQPDFSGARVNLGNALRALGRPEEAIAAYRRALESNPDSAEAHFSLALTLLLVGRFEEGWHEYEWRWRTEQMAAKRAFEAPEWDGGGLRGKTVLVWSEQGVGDEIMFSTCLPDFLATANPAECIYECDARLVGLYRRTFSGLTVVPKPPAERRSDRGVYPPFDVHAPVGDLPRVFRAGAEEFPDHITNLVPDPERVELWRSRLDQVGGGLKVGIAWRGGGRTDVRERRSISATELRPLLSVENVAFVNLQYGDCEEELQAIENATGVRIHDWEDVDPSRDLEGQAAQIACLDLVIQASNASAHLAGVLGVPVWNLIPFAPDSRWLLERDDSPWYPTMRLFRQPESENWATAVKNAAGALEELRRET